MEIYQDFKELFELLNKHKVEYLVVGGYALAFYGAPRFTGDIDLLVNSSTENARRILVALAEFGFGSLGLQESDFTIPQNVIQLGVPPVRIDILTSLSGVSWQEAQQNKISGMYGQTPVFIISKQNFIANKKALGRTKDLADIESISDNGD